MKPILLSLFLFNITFTFSQDSGFPFGQATYKELEMKSYDKDTIASAVVIDEYGEAYFEDGNEYNLIFEYHVRIKILKQQGLEEATVEIPLYKSENNQETLNSIRASAFNIENGSLKETKLDLKNVFDEKTNKNWNVKKLAIPNAHVGSVIEYQYKIESPFFYNFRSWPFQSKNPKMKSVFLATLPANYNYNITLKGFLKFSNYESKVIRECFYQGKADCSENRFTMVDIPAFVEEEFMTAKSNFLSEINFELSEVKHFDGRVTKYTEEWSDVDLKMRRHENFGIQLRKGEGVVSDQMASLISGETDALAKARRIYDYIKYWYQWDERTGAFCEYGIKEAFEIKKGNVADINLTLIAALRYAGLDVEPVILSTREKGLPIEVHPVISDFNYVIAKLNLNDQTYLLDATDDFVPFGTIPIRCVNGKGRVLADKGSYWIELKSTDKAKHIANINLKLNDEGKLTGTIQNQYSGYDAISRRKKIAQFSDEKEYFEKLKAERADFKITNPEILNMDDFTKPLIEKFEVEIEAYAGLNITHFLFNPFIQERTGNPFKSNERSYPVDFGAPIEKIIVFSLEYPNTFEVSELPEKIGLMLPNSGGKYLFGVQNIGNKITMSSTLSINRTVYSSNEYHYLKELYTRIVQVQQADWVFRRK